MRLKKYLQEKYAFSKQIHGNYVEVFVNPSHAEISRLINNSKFKEVRFSAWDHTEKVYIWDANLAIHHQIEGEIEGRDAWSEVDYLLSGNAKLKGNKLVATRSDQLQHYVDNPETNYLLAGVLDRNWNWVKRFIGVKGLLKQYKAKL